VVRYQDLRGEWKEVRAGEERDLSELLQHEIDHLTGFWPSTASAICARCAHARNLERYRAQSPYATQDRAAS